MTLAVWGSGAGQPAAPSPDPAALPRALSCLLRGAPQSLANSLQLQLSQGPFQNHPGFIN